jgi:dTDP-4-amino-4,6-dideoxygalactose transaminase
MRGHVCDMEALMALCDRLGLTVIEDCAHTMGAEWRRALGRHGAIGCYSTQTYKHMNSGEGGLIVTDDADLAARMVLLSGSLHAVRQTPRRARGRGVPRLRLEVPNVSGRMDNLRAAVLRPQIALLRDRRARWAALYRGLEAGLQGVPGLRLIAVPKARPIVGSSFQFLLPDWERRGSPPSWPPARRAGWS